MRILIVLFSLLLLSAVKPAAWTLVSVAGSDRQHVFDHARTKVAQVFKRKVKDVRYLSATARIGDLTMDRADKVNLEKALKDNNGKCFLFMTSHGREDGFFIGNERLTPTELDAILTRTCPGPTVVVISACYSGTFAYGPMQKPNRIILTAAAPDRSSFGCTNDLQYTFWDECFLNNVLGAKDWRLVYDRTAYCVGEQEKMLKYTPSRPLLFIGKNIKANDLLP